MRVLFVNLPFAGHTNPTLPLVKALIHSGHQVTYINSEEWGPKIEACGAQFIPYRHFPQKPSLQQIKKHCFQAAFETVMSVGHDYEILIYEMLFFPGKEIADRLGIPCVRQFSQPAWNQQTYSILGKDYRFFHFSSTLIGRQLMNPQARKALAMPEKKLLDSLLYEEPNLNLVYLPEAFQPGRESFDSNYLFIPPDIHIPESVPAKTGTSVIYISLGTIVSSKAFCQKCIKAFSDQPVQVFLSTGKVPVEALGNLPKNIQAAQFLPQIELLAQADLFLTHGGMNSVNEALQLGVPMLVVPFLNDQPMNAKQVVRIGAGERLSPLGLTVDKLQKAATNILENEQLYKRMNTLQTALQNGLNLSDAVATIEKLKH